MISYEQRRVATTWWRKRLFPREGFAMFGHANAARFQTKLAELLKEIDDDYCFGIDHYPDPILAAALEAAGVNVGLRMWPPKIFMYFEAGGVSVGAPDPYERLL